MRTDLEDVEYDYNLDLESTVRYLLLSLKEAERKGINVVFIVKRSKSQLISPNKRDIAIFEKILNIGEYYGPLPPTRLWRKAESRRFHPAQEYYARCEAGSGLDILSEDFLSVFYMKTSSMRPPIS